MNKKIIELKNLFLQKVSLGNDVDDEILSKIDEILYFINDAEINDLRQTSANLSYELHELGSSSIPYLLMLLLNKLEAVSYKPNYKSIKLSCEIEIEPFMKYFERCFESCEQKGIRILDFELPVLDEKELLNIYCCTRDMLNMYASEPINIRELNAEIPPRAICLGISKVLSKKYNCQHEFFIQFSSILERMNMDGLYQEARDCAEEALMCSHNYNVLYYGHYARFSIYTSQTNVIDSLLHGCLLYTSLCGEESICEELIEKSYIATFLALRTFRFFTLAKDVYKAYISGLNLDEYHKQKLDVAMFYMKIMENDSSIIKDIDIYLKTKKDKILGFGKASLIPWFTLICNIKVLFEEEYKNKTDVMEFECVIEHMLSMEEVKGIKAKILKENPDGREALIDGLVNLSRTRNRADYVHEVNQLIVTANRVIENSLNKYDVEGVLLGHQLNSDAGVSFVGNTIDSISGTIHQTFNLEGENSSRFRDYLNYVNDRLAVNNSQFLWIGTNNERVYAVVFEHGSFTFCDYIKSTSKKEIKEWIQNCLQDLAFNDSPVTGSPFITREDIWQKEKCSIVDNLPEFNIPLSSREIVIFSDVGFSSYPHN